MPEIFRLHKKTGKPVYFCKLDDDYDDSIENLIGKEISTRLAIKLNKLITYKSKNGENKFNLNFSCIPLDLNI